ncbi:hypothetical protein ACLKA6_000117 [Drosophila palustris]
MAIAVRPQPHLNFNMLPMSATMGLADASGGSRAGTPTKSDIVPAITVTASPGPGSLHLANTVHGLKSPNSGSDSQSRQLTTTTTTTPTMSVSGRSQCF